MGNNPAKVADRSYEDVEPCCQWQEEKEQVVLHIDLPGYKKSELHVETKNEGSTFKNGTLVIRGERRVDQGKWQRFCKEIELDKHWKREGINAQICGSGKLSVTIPKKQEQAIGSLLVSSSSKPELKKPLWKISPVDRNLAFDIAEVALLFILIILMLAFSVYVAQIC